MSARKASPKGRDFQKKAQSLSEQYDLNLERFDALGQEVKFAIDQEIKDRNLKIHESSYRVKSLSSLQSKIASKQFDERIDAVDDVVGARIVCLFRSDIDTVLSIIDSIFEVESKDDKTQSDPEVFGYFSTHLICKLKSAHSGPRYDRLRDVRFEIQVRTLCMHAWSVVSHYLDYKGDWDVPVELKRSLNALSGLFWVADSQFEAVSKERALSLAGAEASAKSGTLHDQPINLDTLRAYLHERYPDRRGDEQDISALVMEVREAGFESIGELGAELERAAKAFEFYEGLNPPVGGRFTDVGVVRVSLTISSDEYLELRLRKYPGSDFKKYYELAREYLS